MNLRETLTWRDIAEIPSLLEAFSARAGALGRTAVRSSDRTVYLVGRGSSGTATLFAKYIWEEYAGTITNFIHPHSIFEAASRSISGAPPSGRSRSRAAARISWPVSGG